MGAADPGRTEERAEAGAGRQKTGRSVAAEAAGVLQCWSQRPEAGAVGAGPWLPFPRVAAAEGSAGRSASGTRWAAEAGAGARARRSRARGEPAALAGARRPWKTRTAGEGEEAGPGSGRSGPASAARAEREEAAAMGLRH